MDNQRATIVVVDDDPSVLRALAKQIGFMGHNVRSFQDPKNALSWLRDKRADCLVLDLMMPGMTGLELQADLAKLPQNLPIVFVSGQASIPATVAAMRAGAVDFLEKPVERSDLQAAIGYALDAHQAQTDAIQSQERAERRFDRLTGRQREVFDHLLRGNSNKEIARTLGISERTVKAHRQMLMEKLSASSLADLFVYATQLGYVFDRDGVRLERSHRQGDGGQV